MTLDRAREIITTQLQVAGGGNRAMRCDCSWVRCSGRTVNQQSMA
jgi:hypothetical protein